MLVYKRKNQYPEPIGEQKYFPAPVNGRKKDSPAPRNRSKKDSLAPNHPERLAEWGKPSIMGSGMYTNPKFLKAMLAMKNRGFSNQICGPVVQNLLESLDKNWELIEQENYKVLADAVRRETEATEANEKHKENEPGKDLINGAIVEYETERPTKKLRRRPKEILTAPDVGPSEVSKESSDSDCEMIEPPPTSLRNSGKQHVAPSLRKESTKKRFLQGLSNRSSSKDPEDNLASTSALPIIVIDQEPLVNGNSSRLSNGLVYIQSDSDTEAVAPNIPQWSHDPNDITRGQENVMIPFVKGPNNDSPPLFYYISHNAVFQNAKISFSLERIDHQNCCSSCSGDCLLSENPCPCSFETGGEYAYTAEGLVNGKFIDDCVSMNRDPEKYCMYYCKDCPEEEESPKKKACKGHLIRKFIKECWLKCGCNMRCGNRVVQRGISRKLQVFIASTEKGWGVRTLEELPKGAFVCEYVGEVLTNNELDERNETRCKNKEKHTYPVQLDADWAAENYLTDDHALCLDATKYGNVARFINHRCGDATLVEIPVEIETPDHHYYHLAFFTTRKVAAMEELTWDYGIDFADDKHPVPAFICKCGSRFCKDVKQKKKSKPRAKTRGVGI